MLWFVRARWVPNEWPPRQGAAHLVWPRAEGALNASGAELALAKHETPEKAVGRLTDALSRDGAKQHFAMEGLNEFSKAETQFSLKVIN